MSLKIRKFFSLKNVFYGKEINSSTFDSPICNDSANEENQYLIENQIIIKNEVFEKFIEVYPLLTDIIGPINTDLIKKVIDAEMEKRLFLQSKVNLPLEKEYNFEFIWNGEMDYFDQEIDQSLAMAINSGLLCDQEADLYILYKTIEELFNKSIRHHLIDGFINKFKNLYLNDSFEI